MSLTPSSTPRVDILVVDDSPAQRISLETVLADLGENVVVVGSGLEALRYLLYHDVAVILLDVNMPEMDGFETATLIRQCSRTRETLRVLLEQDGHEVLTAATGEDGLDRALSHAPAIALGDLGLPDLDGFEVARRLQAVPQGAAVRLVAISGYGQPMDRARTRSSGFDAHLVKPVEAARLRAVLAECAARSLDGPPKLA